MEQKAAIPADNSWIEHNIRDLRGSPGGRIGDEWMLLTSGDASVNTNNWNTMTASWGGLGVLWGFDAATVYVRPTRHTFAFMNDNSLFTLSFFAPAYRKALTFCGEKSGRDYDKAAEAGLTPIVFGSGLAGGRAKGAVAFREASEIIICRKLYAHDFDPAQFLDKAIEGHYPGKDYHRLYVGEILTLLEGSKK